MSAAAGAVRLRRRLRAARRRLPRARRGDASQALHAPDTSFVIVTSPEPDTIDATLDFDRELRAGGFPVAGVIANRVLDFPPLGRNAGERFPARAARASCSPTTPTSRRAPSATGSSWSALPPMACASCLGCPCWRTTRPACRRSKLWRRCCWRSGRRRPESGVRSQETGASPLQGQAVEVRRRGGGDHLLPPVSCLLGFPLERDAPPCVAPATIRRRRGASPARSAAAPAARRAGDRASC